MQVPYFVYFLRYRGLRRPYDYLVLNLMVSDLMMIVPNFPMTLYNSFYGKWMFNQIG